MIAALLWLGASSLWAYVVIILRDSVDPNNWIYQNNDLNNTICARYSNGTYIYDQVLTCSVNSSAVFTGAYTAMVAGFLSFILWTAHSMFLYKGKSEYSGYEFIGAPRESRIPRFPRFPRTPRTPRTPRPPRTPRVPRNLSGY